MKLNEVRYMKKPSSHLGSQEALDKCYLLLIQYYYVAAVIVTNEIYSFGEANRSISRPVAHRPYQCGCPSRPFQGKVQPVNSKLILTTHQTSLAHTLRKLYAPVCILNKKEITFRPWLFTRIL